MISKELRSIFTQAVGYAKSSKHEYLTLEHIFLMLIHDQTIENLFIDLGVDTNKLFDDTKKLNPSFNVTINDVVPYQFKLPAAPYVAKGSLKIFRTIL